MNSNFSYNNNYNNSLSTRSNNIIKEKPKKELPSLLSLPDQVNTAINNTTNTIKCSRKKTGNKVTKPQKKKNSKKNILKSFESLAYNSIVKKYNYTLEKYNLLCINQLLANRSCRLVSIFKEKMITDYIDEFLKRKYSFKESKDRIPKFYLYYKHYSIFFGQPFFSNFNFNMILQKNGEKKARIYYKNHYQNGESKDEDNENIGFAESGSDEEDEDKKNNMKKNNNGKIFSSEIKDNIDNVTVMTTINSFENNTINLGLNNEKIEIFSENKMEKSNDTTIGELMDDINRGIEEANKIKNKNKKKKKKNFSLGDNFLNLLKKNINSNVINENIKKNKKKIIELINNNNIKKKIKNISIKKKLFYVGHQNINLNTNRDPSSMSSATQRYNNKKNSVSYKKDNIHKKNISTNNTHTNTKINSTKAYKKRKLLSCTNEEVNKLMDSNNQNYFNNHRSPRQQNKINIKINDNYLRTINQNPIYGHKKFNNLQKINSPLSINNKQLLSNYSNLNSNVVLSSINNTLNMNNKIKICKTLKNFVDKNKPKKNISKNITKEINAISGDRKKKINKFSFRKFELDNFPETQIFKENNNIKKKPKGRNIISPLNNKYIENYTMSNDYINVNNLPFSANKNKTNTNNNNKLFNNKAILNNINYQTINNEQEFGHQRTKSNFVTNNIKKPININNPIFTTILNTDSNNAYIKPAIRIKKSDRLYMNKPIVNDGNNDISDNKTNLSNNNVFNNKKLSYNNANCFNSINLTNNNNTNTNVNKDFKNNNIIHNKNIKNTNFNKYILEVIKKTKHQHYNSLTSQMNPTHTFNLKDNMIKNKKKISNLNLNHNKGFKDKDVLQIALSLFVNENSSRNHNQTNILEPSTTNNHNYSSTYYKVNNNRQNLPKNHNNNIGNNKRNYNLNININNEININENNTINNSTYINHTHRLNSKNLGKGGNLLKNYIGDGGSRQKEKKKCIVNLKQKKYNIDSALNSNNRTNNCNSTKNNNGNDKLLLNLNGKKGKKIKTRNYGNKNIHELLNTINNNFINTVILNNNSVDNKVINYNKINNIINKNNNIIKSYHTKSVTSLSDLMFHNKKLISLYKNISKSK